MTDRWEEIERIGAEPQPSDRAFGAFAAAAATACLFELKARLFADNTPELQRYKDDPLEALVRRVVEHLGSTLTDDEAVHLRKCARVRNRLLHADFSKAAGTMLSVGVAIEQGRVQIIDLSDGSVRKVSDTSSADGAVFAWVLEGTSVGTFSSARAFFLRGVALINWLLARVSEGKE
jgi:hypothetical protein